MARKEVTVIGNIYYYNDQDRLHREDGPAVEFNNGYKAWLINGMRHRIDGAAIEYATGIKSYFIIGKHYSYKEWLAIKDFPLLW